MSNEQTQRVRRTPILDRVDLQDFNRKRPELVFDFSDNWHCALRFALGDTPREVAGRLRDIADLIEARETPNVKPTHPTSASVPDAAPSPECREAWLPCPFCGNRDLKSGGDDKVVGVWCENCGASGPNHYSNHEWNARTPTPPITPEQREAVAEQMCEAYDGVSSFEASREAMKAALDVVIERMGGKL